MIAMALACDPELVVADEPTTALDVMVQAQVLDVLSDLVRERGVGMMMISHDLSVLADVCDRITVMYAGRVVEEGPADAIFSEPLHPYSGALSAAFPRVGDPAARFAPAGLPGDPPDPRNLPGGAPSRPRCPRAAEVCLPAEPELATYAEGRAAAACVRIGEPDEPPRPTSAHERGAVGHRAPGRVLDPLRPGCARARRRRPASSGPARSSRWWESRARARRRSPARWSA